MPDPQIKKVALGLSGGVDSSLCAHLLVEQGYEVTGVFLECWRSPGCRTDQDRADALKVALSLNIPFQVIDFKQAYYDRVVADFFAEYQAGRTPNPDVHCNKEIKFGLFYDWAISHGFDAVATGHYAKIITDATNQKQLAIPKDSHKDQTYFLYLLTASQLDHLVFPLANLTKPAVRQLAQQKKLHNANKKDSVGICFIGDINVHDFLRERLGEKLGDVVDTQGHVIGHHQGVWFYTIGQRHGFTVAQKSLFTQPDGSTVTKENLPPFYVISKNARTNQLVVGFGADTLQQTITLDNLHTIHPQQEIHTGEPLLVRIRHTGQLLPCSINRLTEKWQITLNQPTQGIAAGQSGVLYKRDSSETIVVGGGTIG